MNIAKIVPYDVANGPGIRMSIFVAGCRRHCPGCFNQEAQNFNYGSPLTPEIEKEIITRIASNDIDGLSFLGGEPFEPENEQQLAVIAKMAKMHMCSSTQDIWCWTGYTWEELTKDSAFHPLLNHIDVLVDGAFDARKKDISLLWRGSSNQRIIDMRKTRSSHSIVLYGSQK